MSLMPLLCELELKVRLQASTFTKGSSPTGRPGMAFRGVLGTDMICFLDNEVPFPSSTLDMNDSISLSSF